MSMTQRVRLRYRDGTIMNDVADYILEEIPDFPDRVQLFELIPSSTPSPELAAGEDAIIEITFTIVYGDSEILKLIDKIQEFARDSGAKEIVIEYDHPTLDDNEITVQS